MVYSHWLSPEPGQGLAPEPGRMGCMVPRKTFHTAPEKGRGTNGLCTHCSGPETVSGGVF